MVLYFEFKCISQRSVEIVVYVPFLVCNETGYNFLYQEIGFTGNNLAYDDTRDLIISQDKILQQTNKLN